MKLDLKGETGGYLCPRCDSKQGLALKGTLRPQISDKQRPLKHKAIEVQKNK